MQKKGEEFFGETKEHESYKLHTVCVSQAKEARTLTEDHDQDDGDTNVENALAALNKDDSTERLLAYRDSRQLRGQQRVNSVYRPVIGRTSGESPTE